LEAITVDPVALEQKDKTSAKCTSTSLRHMPDDTNAQNAVFSFNGINHQDAATSQVYYLSFNP